MSRPSRRGDGVWGRAYAVDAPLGRRHFGDLERKTVEAWLLHDFAADFYGRTLRLLIVGYVRPELKFDSTWMVWCRIIRADGDFASGSSATRPRMMTGSWRQRDRSSQKEPVFAQLPPEDKNTLTGTTSCCDGLRRAPRLVRVEGVAAAVPIGPGQLDEVTWPARRARAPSPGARRRRPARHRAREAS